MKNIVMCRIDDRLIHGQVVTAWVKQLEVNDIVIVDDALAKDVFLQKIMKASAPTGVSISVLPVKKADQLLLDESTGNNKTMILVKGPEVVEELLDLGIHLEKVVVGGMGAKVGRRKFNRNVSASDEEVSCMKRILARNVSMVYQLVPNDVASDLSSILH